MHIKSFRQKDRYGNETAVEFFDVPEMQIPQYDHPGDPKGPDTVPAWLTPGEFVVNAEAVRMFEPEIEAMNNIGRNVQKAQGGTIPEGGTMPNEPVYAYEGFLNKIKRNVKRNTKRLTSDPSQFLSDFVEDTAKGVERIIPDVPEINIQVPKVEAAPKIPGAKLVNPSTGEVIKQYYNTEEELSDDGIILRGPGGSGIYRPKDENEIESRGGTIRDFGDVLFESDGGRVPIYANEGITANELLRKFLMRDDVEGFTSTPQKDTNGYAIGFGSTRDVTPDTKPIDRDQAMLLLDRDITDANNAYNKLVTADLNPYQQAAVNSLIYNIGQGRFSESEALKRLNEGDFEGYLNEADEFRLANDEVLPGLVKRRALERDLFNTPYQVANESLLSKLGIVSEANATPSMSVTPPPEPTALGLSPDQYKQFEQQQIAQADNMVANGDGDDLGMAVPRVSDEPPKDDRNFFQKYILGEKTQDLFSGNKQSVPAYNAEANRKIVAGNAEAVAETFKQFEMKRLDNLAKGRDEFDGINKNTYNKAKQAVEFQKGQLVDATQKSLDLNNVDRGLADATINKLTDNVNELGVPKPEDLSVYQSDGYQSMLERVGGLDIPTTDEWVELHTENQEGTAPVERIVGKTNVGKDSPVEANIAEVAEITNTTRPDGKPQAEVITANPDANKIIGEIFSATEGEDTPDTNNTPPGDVGDLGNRSLNENPKLAESILGFFKGAFSDLFDGRELARMAIMYAGSRALGYSHYGSLNYSMKSYIKRVDANVAAREKFVNSEAAINAYTAASLANYRESGDRNDLIAKEPTAQGLGDNIYHEQYGVLPTVKIGDGKYAIELGGEYYSFDDPIMVGKVHKYDKELHDPVTYMEFFNDRANNFSDQAARRHKRGKENVDMSTVDNSLHSDDAANLFQEQVLLFGATPAAQSRIRSQISQAMNDFYDATAKAIADGKTPPASMHQFYHKRALSQRTGGQVSYEMVKDVDAETFALLDRTILQNAMATGNDLQMNAKVYRNAWSSFEKIWKKHSKDSKFVKSDIMGKDSKHNNFTYWIQSVLDPNSYMHEDAIALLAKGKE